MVLYLDKETCLRYDWARDSGQFVEWSANCREVSTVSEARPSARATILQLLKQSKGLTAQELAAVLTISPVAVRKHLDTLQQEGLVCVALRRRPMGRRSE